MTYAPIVSCRSPWGLTSACFFGSRRNAGGLPGVRRSGPGEADAGLITVGELDAGDQDLSSTFSFSQTNADAGRVVAVEK